MRHTLESLIVDLGNTLPRLFSYEQSAGYEVLNQRVFDYYTKMLEVFLEANHYINEISKSTLFHFPHKKSPITNSKQRDMHLRGHHNR